MTEQEARAGLVDISNDRVVGCGWRAEEHWHSRRAWQFDAYVLALVAGVASALVATDLFATGKGPLAGAAPYLGAVAAVAVAVTTIFDAQGKAVAHKTGRDGFSDLVVGFRRFRDSTAHEEPFAHVKAAFDALEERHSVLQATAPEPGNVAKWAARRSIKRKQNQET